MKRFTATEKWQKDWFQSLTPGEKCLWNYLCDNCDAAGVWEPNWRLASFVINETFTCESLSVFGERIRILPDGKIWLTGFCEFQYSQLSRECRPHVNIIRILEKHSLLHEVEHLLAGAADNPSDTLWYRVVDRDKEKDKDKDKEQETDQVPPAFDPERYSTELLGRGGPGVESERDVYAASVTPELLPAPMLSVVTMVPEGKTPRRKPELAALGQRIGAVMRRRPGSRWSERELSALSALFPIAEDDLILIERYYGAEIAHADDIRRRDLLTLLNHWPGELDRARAFWRKRGWRAPAGEEAHGETAAVVFPEGFADWKAQASEYNSTVWREWSLVPEFAREEFHRWKRRGRRK